MKEDVERMTGFAEQVQIEREGERIRVTAGFRDGDLIKSIPGARWSAKERCYFLWCTWSSCVQARATFGERLDVGPELYAWAAAEVAGRVNPCMELRDAATSERVPADWELFPRQRSGVDFLATARHAVLGDEMGAGKTRQIIYALEHNNCYPAIIVATRSAKRAWRDEFAQLPGVDRKVVVVEGSAAQRRKALAEDADVYIVHWQILRYHSRLAGYGYIKLTDEEKTPKELNKLGARAVIADEAHRLQDPKAKQTRALWALGDDVPADGMRIAATGTPLPNHLGNLWSTMRFCDAREWPSKSAFIDRYAMQSWSPFGFNEIAGLLPGHRDEFFKIFDPRFMRRTKKIVTPDLPEKIYMPPRYVTLGAAQRRAYKQMQDELLAELEDGNVLMAKNPLVRAVRLRQFASATVVLNDEGGVTMTDPSAVIDELMEVLEELEDKQVLYFAESRQLIELAAQRVAKHHISTGLITGSVSDDDRERRRLEFQDGHLRTMGLTMGAGGESITLTAASAVVFLDRSFSLVKNKQAEDRAHRPGQTDDVMIIDIVPEDTIYEGLREAVVAKEENAEEICRDRSSLLKFIKGGSV